MEASDIKHEENIVQKEEEWLIREIKLLEEFQKYVSELLQIEPYLNEIKKSTDMQNIPNIIERADALKEKIHSDENKLRGLRRLLSRSERKRVRYEKRFLSEVLRYEKSLDKITNAQLNQLCEQINLYSARLIAELSWRVGKISELTSQKSINPQILNEHINTVIKASNALLALIENLKRLMSLIENRLCHKKAIMPYLNQIAGLTGFFRECAVKTAIVKSIPPLRYFLERGITKKITVGIGSLFGKKDYNEFGNKYNELIDRYLPQLSKGLSQNDINQLRKVYYEVPKEGILLFVPGFKRPILAFNLHNIPNFTSWGWLSHAIPAENLEKAAKTGLLMAPLEMAFSKKKYFSDKASSSPEKRLLDGISFCFQDYKRYQAYMLNANRTGVGAMLIYPMKNVLGDGLILDFKDLIDQYPEIVLRDEAYIGNKGYIIAKMLDSLRRYDLWLERYEEYKLLFSEAKANLPLLEHLANLLQKNEVVHTHKIADTVFLKKEMFSLLSPLKEVEEARKSLGPEFMEKKKEAYKKNPAEFKQLDEVFRRKIAEIVEQHIKEQSLCFGKGILYEKLKIMYLSKETLEGMIKFIKENNFLSFSLLVGNIGIFSSPKYLTPTLKRYDPTKPLWWPKGTIFQWGMYQYLFSMNFSGECLTLILMKDKPDLFKGVYRYSLKGENAPAYYVDYMCKLSPRNVKNLFEKTRAEIIDELEVIIQKKFRTKIPAVVPLNKGVVLMNGANRDEATLRNLISHNATVFHHFSYDINGGFIDEELDFFMRKIIQIRDLPSGIKFYNKQSYFYLKNGKLIVCQRADKKQFVIA